MWTFRVEKSPFHQQKGNSLNIPGCDSWGWKCCLLSWESAAQSLKKQQSGHPTLLLLPLSFKARITPTSTMTVLDTSAKILQHTLQWEFTEQNVWAGRNRVHYFSKQTQEEPTSQWTLADPQGLSTHRDTAAGEAQPLASHTYNLVGETERSAGTPMP